MTTRGIPPDAQQVLALLFCLRVWGNPVLSLLIEVPQSCACWGYPVLGYTKRTGIPSLRTGVTPPFSKDWDTPVTRTGVLSQERTWDQRPGKSLGPGYPPVKGETPVKTLLSPSFITAHVCSMMGR